MQFKFDRAANCDKLEKEGNLKEISPKADVITSYYYKGRINIFSSKFGDASTNLK